MESTKAIDVVSFAKSYPEFLLDMLSGIGWEYQYYPARDWLSRSDMPKKTSQIVVLLFDGSTGFDLPSLLAAIEQLTVPTLLITLDESCNINSKILSKVGDFILAPVHAAELEQRLSSLCIAMPDDNTEQVTVQTNIHNPISDSFVSMNIIGESQVFRNTLQTVRKIAKCLAPVLVSGETGTGKELIARAVHYLSQRCNGPFIPVNCGAFSDELILSELFGHEKGAFTGAQQRHIGLIEQAHMGTLFLDEVDSLSQKTQVALLRFFQAHEFKPLGGRGYKKSDVRIVTATNTDLKQLVKENRFREDLYYRLDILNIHLPPLRERKGDVGILAENFLGRLDRIYRQPGKSLHPDMLEWMNNHAWYGNVRELENYIHRVYVLSDEQIINYLPTTFLGTAGNTHTNPLTPTEKKYTHSFGKEKEKVVACFAKDYLHHILQTAAGNISLAAKKAGKERRAFTRLLQRYGIDRQPHL